MTEPNLTNMNSGWADPIHIVDHPTLAVPEKRSLLASWASDARAVPNSLSLRRLDDGRLVTIDAVLDALKRLDAIGPGSTAANDRPHQEPSARALRPGHWSRLSRRWRRGRDDDDDPPPAVVADLPRLPTLGGDVAAAAPAA